MPDSTLFMESFEWHIPRSQWSAASLHAKGYHPCHSSSPPLSTHLVCLAVRHPFPGSPPAKMDHFKLILRLIKAVLGGGVGIALFAHRLQLIQWTINGSSESPSRCSLWRSICQFKYELQEGAEVNFQMSSYGYRPLYVFFVFLDLLC